MAGKKTGKRLLTWVLVLVMALSLLPLNALADSDLFDEPFDELPVDEDRIEADEDASDEAELTALPVWDYDHYTGAAEFYYLKSPTSDPNSNGPNAWGKVPLGVGKIKINYDRFKHGKNAKNIKSNEIISWPKSSQGGLSFTLDKSNKGIFEDNWKEIYSNYKASLEKELGVTIESEDIESITFKPYKISRWNLLPYDYHVDCKVEIKCTKVVTATFYFVDSGSENVQLLSKNYKINGYIPEDDIADAEREANKLVPEDYELIKWYTDSAFTTEANPSAELTGNVDFYCKCEPVKTYNVTYTDGVDDEEVFADQVTRDLRKGADTPAFNGGIPTRKGYNFTNWLPAVAETVTDNATYTAQWEKDDSQWFTVKYDANGGTGTVNDNTEYLSGTKVTVMDGDGLKKDGYDFTSWNTEANGNGTTYQKGDEFEITGNTTLYAQWKVKEYPFTVN